MITSNRHGRKKFKKPRIPNWPKETQLSVRLTRNPAPPPPLASSGGNFNMVQNGPKSLQTAPKKGRKHLGTPDSVQFANCRGLSPPAGPPVYLAWEMKEERQKSFEEHPQKFIFQIRRRQFRGVDAQKNPLANRALWKPWARSSWQFFASSLLLVFLGPCSNKLVYRMSASVGFIEIVEHRVTIKCRKISALSGGACVKF